MKKNNDNFQLKYTTLQYTDDSHIEIIDENICLNKCQKRPCTYFCPGQVFHWSDKKNEVFHTQCLECGACPWGCPHNNIKWSLPPGGKGVVYGQNQI